MRIEVYYQGSLFNFQQVSTSETLCKITKEVKTTLIKIDTLEKSYHYLSILTAYDLMNFLYDI